MEEYHSCREQIYGQLRAEGIFTWDRLYDKEYALATSYAVREEEINELRKATRLLGRIFAKTVSAVQQGDQKLLTELSLPDGALAAVRLQVMPQMATLIGRFDFVRTATGWKMIEFNSDTPGGIVEAFYVNARVCDYYGFADPNAGCEGNLADAFRHILHEYKILGYNTAKIYFSALDWHEEDAGTARYLLEQSHLDAKFVSLKDLRTRDDSLYALVDGVLEKVDVWYRLHPLGVLAEDKDDDGYPTGEHVLSLIARGKLAVINPPGALIAQTKALQALIWGLHEANVFFDADEQTAIQNYMLPTYLENRFYGRCAYAVKPVLGREGGGVAIYDRNGKIIARNEEQYYQEQAVVYQKYQEPEQVEMETLAGKYTGRLIWGSFLVGGNSSAVVARAGGHITDDLAYFVPICLAK